MIRTSGDRSYLAQRSLGLCSPFGKRTEQSTSAGRTGKLGLMGFGVFSGGFVRENIKFTGA